MTHSVSSQPEAMEVWLIGDSKLPLSTAVSINGFCFVFSQSFSPVINYRPIEGVTLPLAPCYLESTPDCHGRVKDRRLQITDRWMDAHFRVYRSL